MEIKQNEVEINGVKYILKDSVSNVKTDTEGLECVMIRTYSAGVHYGYLKSKEYTSAGTIVVLINARRVWQWSGAATLSQLAMEGTKDPSSCKMPQYVNTIELNAIEIIPMTKTAVDSLNNVEIWKK